MAKNSRMALCCQNQGTNQRYELHSGASIFVQTASVTVLGLLKKKKDIWTLTVDADADVDSGHGQKQACSHEYHNDWGEA